MSVGLRSHASAAHARTITPTLERGLRALRAVRGVDAPHWLTAHRLRFYATGVLICYVLWLAIYFVKAVWMPRAYISPLSMDFLPFWSASHLALSGHAVDAYNLIALEKIETAAIAHPVGILPWLYPPTFLLVVYPFALLPWKIAAALFLGGTYLLFAKAMHTIVPRKETIFLALAFPGAALVEVSGQNGLLTAALAAFGLALLARRPVIAGICLGILSVKPQLAVLIPLALLCSRSWRALAAFGIVAVAMLLVSVMAFGTDTLAAFIHNMGMAAGYVESGRAALARIPSAFSLVKLAHGTSLLASVAQGLSLVFAAATVCYAWYRSAPHALRAATLACASLMVSPYLYDYDLTWLGVVIAWYASYAMERGWKPGEREWLIVLWLMPLAGILVVTRIHFQFMPLVFAMTLALLSRRIWMARRDEA
ncbi:DUF2029 domain-containing protein [Trinickia sp. LjRoot230]|uniref:glycosyltransferase family 87 protein n=1 Tax=Trinickia sp. LjRoot230 TaxID=3342288 RepID=UPI003ECDF2EF